MHGHMNVKKKVSILSITMALYAERRREIKCLNSLEKWTVNTISDTLIEQVTKYLPPYLHCASTDDKLPYCKAAITTVST
jgi:hypothetical protein